MTAAAKARVSRAKPPSPIGPKLAIFYPETYTMEYCEEILRVDQGATATLYARVQSLLNGGPWQVKRRKGKRPDRTQV